MSKGRTFQALKNVRISCLPNTSENESWHDVLLLRPTELSDIPFELIELEADQASALCHKATLRLLRQLRTV